MLLDVFFLMLIVDGFEKMFFCINCMCQVFFFSSQLLTVKLLLLFFLFDSFVAIVLVFFFFLVLRWLRYFYEDVYHMIRYDLIYIIMVS